MKHIIASMVAITFFILSSEAFASTMKEVKEVLAFEGQISSLLNRFDEEFGAKEGMPCSVSVLQVREHDGREYFQANFSIETETIHETIHYSNKVEIYPPSVAVGGIVYEGRPVTVDSGEKRAEVSIRVNPSSFNNYYMYCNKKTENVD